MEERKAQEESLQTEDWKRLRRGWCWGDKTFREELLGMIGEQQAQRLLGQMLRKVRWTEADLAERRKGDEVKVQMATRLRTETTMSWKWIAQRLSMGHWRSAANAVRTAR